MALAKWQRLRDWQEHNITSTRTLAVLVMFNLIHLVILGVVFIVLVEGTTAGSTILSTYTAAVFGVVFLLLTLVGGLTASDRKDRERLGITTATGMLCGAFLIVFGQIVIGALFLLGWFFFFIFYCLIISERELTETSQPQRVSSRGKGRVRTPQ